SSASRRAIAQAIERLLATPRTRPCFPANEPGMRGESTRASGTLLTTLRRPLALAAAVAALVLTAPAAAGLQPVRRTFGDVQVPRVRHGATPARPAHRPARVRVIVTLQLPPLAE